MSMAEEILMRRNAVALFRCLREAIEPNGAGSDDGLDFHRLVLERWKKSESGDHGLKPHFSAVIDVPLRRTSKLHSDGQQ